MRLGFSALAIAVLVHAGWLYWIGFVLVAVGFALNVFEDAESPSESAVEAAALGRRPLGMLLVLFVLTFTDLASWPRSSGVIGMLLLNVVVIATTYRLPSPLGSIVVRRRGAGAPASRPGSRTTRDLGLLVNLAGWVLFAGGLGVAAAQMLSVVTFRPLGQMSTLLEFGRAIDELVERHGYGLTLAFLMGLLLVNCGAHLRSFGRRLLTRVVDRPGDGERFVLYLRSFDQDVRLAEGALAPLTSLAPPLADNLVATRSHEERLVDELHRALGCRVIAASSPKDPCPPPGAERITPLAEHWQSVIGDLISRAELVVISVAPSAGAMWELVEAVTVLPPRRLVLVIPMAEPDYQRLRRLYGHELQARTDSGGGGRGPALPDLPRGARVMPGPLQFLIYFDPDWTSKAWALGSARPPMFTNDLRLPLRVGLGPALERIRARDPNSPTPRERAAWWWLLGRAQTVVGLTGSVPILVIALAVDQLYWWMIWGSLAYAYLGLILVHRGSLLTLRANLVVEMLERQRGGHR